MADHDEPARSPSPRGPYSLGRVSRCGLVFVSGQTAATGAAASRRPEDIEDQTRQVISNIAAILGEFHGQLADVIKTTVFLADMGDFERMNAVYGAAFPKPYPARTTVQAGLAAGLLIEIDAIADIAQ